MPRRCDLWRVGIVDAPIATIMARGSLAGLATRWLPPGPSFTFLADPFGLWRDGVLHLFAEAYDYRSRHGVIDLLRFDAALQMLDRRRVLAEPWHLSYPYVFEADGETWMLPEAHRSGALTLYRADRFPDRWSAAATIALDVVAVDATPLFHDGGWWLFYAGAGRAATSELRVAYADRLAGPWTPHPRNPVRVDRAGSRPGGTAFVLDGQVVLPVQDCSRTYGGAVRGLRFTRLDRAGVETVLGPAIPPPAEAAPYVEGLHTLAAAGDITLVDVKRVDRSGRGWLLDARRWLGARAGG